MDNDRISCMGAISSTCPVCKKPFLYYREHHVYKKLLGNKLLFFCGWNCMRKFEKTVDKSIYKIDKKENE